MTAGLRTSKTRSASRSRGKPTRRALEQPIETANRDWRFEDLLAAPPQPRRRKREARYWLDVLEVVTSNPPLSQRRPGDGWLTIDEKQVLWNEAHERLRQKDRELYRAVERVKWDQRRREHQAMIRGREYYYE